MEIDSPKNMFAFECVVTGDNERLALCMLKRKLKWMGKTANVAVCDCAMDAGKCAVARMISPHRQIDERALLDTTGGRVRALPPEIVEAVNRCRPTSTMLAKYPQLTAEEHERLNHTEFAEGKALPKRQKRPAPVAASVAASVVEHPEAIGGDMATMLNRAMEAA